MDYSFYFIHIFDFSEDVTYNLYEEYDIEKCKIASNKMTRWHSIDVNYILPRHRALHQMPGMFKPSLVRQCKY